MSKKFGLGKGLNALIPEEANLSSLGNKIEKKEEREEAEQFYRR